MTAGRPRRERRGGKPEWVVDVPHAESCPSRVLHSLRDGVGAAAVQAAGTDVPLAYYPVYRATTG